MRSDTNTPEIKKANTDSLAILSPLEYHELAESTVRESDLFSQLRANLAQLGDLHGRLGFALREISYHVKKD
jgi:hypothetical protein